MAAPAEVPVLSTDTGFPPEMVGSREAKEFFDENGYMIVRGCLSPLEVSECAVTIRELHERAARGEPGSFGFETLARDQLTADGLPILRKIEQTGELSPVFHRLAEHPTLIRAWQNAIGDDNLLLFRSTLMLKPAEHGSAHALHQGACTASPPRLYRKPRVCAVAQTPLIGRCGPPARPSPSPSRCRTRTRGTAASASSPGRIPGG